MAETDQQGFLARRNVEVGRALGALALAVSVLLGAGLMLGTGTRGISAILTVVTVAGGCFTLLLLGVGLLLETAVPPQQWRTEEDLWRSEMGLAPLAEDETGGVRSPARAAAVAALAIVVGLALSIGPSLV